MKRYRGKNANHHRFADAFVPAHKWGKRNKRQFAKDMQEALTTLDGIASHVKAMTWDELYALAVTAHTESMKDKAS